MVRTQIYNISSQLPLGCAVIDTQCTIPKYDEPTVVPTPTVTDSDSTTDGAVPIVASGWKMLLFIFTVCSYMYIL